MLWTPSRRNAGRIDCFDLFSNFAIPKATLAQSVEQRIRNAQVASSSLVSGSKRQPSGCLFSLYTGAAAPDPCSAQVAFRHFCLRKKSRDRAGALLSTSRQGKQLQQSETDPRQARGPARRSSPERWVAVAERVEAPHRGGKAGEPSRTAMPRSKPGWDISGQKVPYLERVHASEVLSGHLPNPGRE